MKSDIYNYWPRNTEKFGTSSQSHAKEVIRMKLYTLRSFSLIALPLLSAVFGHNLGDTRSFDLNRPGVCGITWHRYDCNGRPIAEAILKTIAEHVEWHHHPFGEGWVGSKTLNLVLQGQDGFLKVIVKEAANNKVELVAVYMLGEDDLYTGPKAIQCHEMPYPRGKKHVS